ncbi:MAG: SDR family NAD(P)-dependent oxidoreductase, partial [Saprospiraceae bacterium]|nr:SDR family NAD(P)-dependent oxidoreductase [Saprospiraceae bacterium]
QHHTDRPEQVPGALTSRVAATDGPVVFLLTDNFLKNRLCMAGALTMFQALAQQNRVLCVVADGQQLGADGRTVERIPTQFDRVGSAIQYLNFWQTAYLDRNAGLTDVAPAEKAAYEQDLEIVRSIANETGELFTALREAHYYSWETLLKDHYALLFRQFNLLDWHEQYKKLAKLDQEAPAPPPAAENAGAPHLAEMPHLAGPLAPAPSPATPETMEPAVPPKTPEQTNGQHLPTPVTFPKTPQEEPNPEAEIAGTIRDAWFWIEKGHSERGLELFRLAIEQYPDNETLQSEYRRAQSKTEKPPQSPEPETVLETPVQAPEPTPEQQQESSSYLQMGENALAKGDYLLAKYCWDRVTELQPEQPGIYRKLALLTSEHLTDYKETAAHYLEQALAESPDDADLHYRLAVLLRDHLDQPGKALQHFRDAVVAQPEHGQAWIALAQFTLEAGDIAQAASLYQHALEVAPDLQSAELDARFLPPAAQPAPQPEQPVAPEPIQQTPEPAETAAIAAPAPQPPPAPPAEQLTVLITGASSGIGRATAALFAQHGHRLILTGRRAERLEELKSLLQADYKNEMILLPFDVRDQVAAEKYFGSLPENWQNIDVLINNAGLAKGLAPIYEGEIEHWETMIDTNLKGLLYMTRLVAPGMVERRKGHIINIGSGAGKEVYPNGNVYCATKFAVDGLTRAMRLDLYQHNVRVSEVSPGHVEETEFALTRFDGNAEKAQIYNDFQPLKASDVAELIYFIVTRPPHVNIQDVWIMGTQQAGSNHIHRSGR